MRVPGVRARSGRRVFGPQHLAGVNSHRLDDRWQRSEHRRQLRRGVLGAADLRERLGVSPATLMRWLREVGADVVQIGRARATR
jgi:hypothetical protein